MKCTTAIILVAIGLCFEASWQLPSKCQIKQLANGKVRGRSRGRIVRFICNEGFRLVGNRYSTCIRGRWDTPAPVCVNSECPTLPLPEHALLAPKFNGAVMTYFCEPGYQLIGTSEIYCDGRNWNDTAPHCRDSTATAPTSCDFEKPDLCWWEEDPTHDFDWIRHNFQTPSWHIGTGPSHDHTLGAGYDGYYLYVEASGRLENETARIFSPLYNASLTQSGCFSFWYHMYGKTIGALQVYFKPETSTLPQMMFRRQGNQGNQWHHGLFNLPASTVSFQIIIEGIRGSSYVSDIAIDDVAILHGDQCIIKNETSSDTTDATASDDQIEIVNAMQSCRGRCFGSNASSVVQPMSMDLCQCTVDCAENSLCCPDYAEYCVLENSTDTDGTTEPIPRTATMAGSTTKRKESPVSEKPIIPTKDPTKNIIPIIPKDDIDPEDTPNPSEKPKPVTEKSIITSSTRKSFVVSTTSRIITSKIINTTTSRSITTLDDNKPEYQTDSHVHIEIAEPLHDEPSPLSLAGVVGIVIGTLAGLAITTVIALVILRKRKSYKRGAQDSGLSEDSDVRFLTSDEVLDFTLAKPSDYEEL
ncbi:MAM and LDL-receptor class A domain-containing protein 1 [Cephus cinctus]|uniref:MAM and LDL-receptor class A domain-containing protein 1 n=1 Tax=Cephus cinctus TaxID=211228 RepID=A0AAJ7FCW0_CEPCN|nr:MAM and LDL-receptor class A domain-containing protein 1 [Cephus cinctus]